MTDVEQVVDGAVFRPVEPADGPALVELMRRTGAHVAGARHDDLYGALLADSMGSDPRIVTVVAEVDGALVGFVSAIASDARRYWRSLVCRHPSAAVGIARHRSRRLQRRVWSRSRRRVVDVTDAALTQPVDLPPEVVARLGRRPPMSGSPRPGEQGAGIAWGLFMSIDQRMRGRGLGAHLFERLFAELRRGGAVRYDGTFPVDDPAAIRMHCRFPFTIYRTSSAYWGSLNLVGPGDPT